MKIIYHWKRNIYLKNISKILTIIVTCDWWNVIYSWTALLTSLSPMNVANTVVNAIPVFIGSWDSLYHAFSYLKFTFLIKVAWNFNHYIAWAQLFKSYWAQLLKAHWA